MDILNNLSRDETYSMLCLLLFASANNPNYSLLHELAYIMDSKSFVKFLKYFEGQTIQIPPLEEIQRAIKTLMLYQYYHVEKMEWHEALTKVGFSLDESYLARTYLTYFIRDLEEHDYKLGGIRNVLKDGKV